MSSVVTALASALAGHYRIERTLGVGGMATVYLAEDLKHHRHVALKVLKPELAAVLGAERFVQEITTTAALQHPNILPLFDSGIGRRRCVLRDAVRGRRIAADGRLLLWQTPAQAPGRQLNVITDLPALVAARVNAGLTTR